MKNSIVILLAALSVLQVNAQQTDSLVIVADTVPSKRAFSISESLTKLNEKRERIKSLIIPAALITYGFVSLENDMLLQLDNQIKENIWTENPHKPIKIDNYLQYSPALAVYGLNALGIKGKNNFRDRTMIYLLSNAMMGVTVQSIKAITRVQRPDGFGTNAFPSGHTATAFVAAEFDRTRAEFPDYSERACDREAAVGVGGFAGRCVGGLAGC